MRAGAIVGPLAFCAGVSAACRDLPTVPEDARACSTTEYFGTFHGNASGEKADTLAGCAYFTIDLNQLTFGMVLTNGGPQTSNPMVKVFRSSMPGSGLTFTVGPTAGQLSGVMFLGSRTFLLSSGTLTSLPPGRAADGAVGSLRMLAGSVDLTGTEVGGATLTVKGSFNGQCVSLVANSQGDPIPKKYKGQDKACEIPGFGLVSP